MPREHQHSPVFQEIAERYTRALGPTQRPTGPPHGEPDAPGPDPAQQARLISNAILAAVYGAQGEKRS